MTFFLIALAIAYLAVAIVIGKLLKRARQLQERAVPLFPPPIKRARRDRRLDISHAVRRHS